MPDDVLERERQLRAEIERELPEFVQVCQADTDVVVMHQDAFAPLLGPKEIVLLGKAIRRTGPSPGIHRPYCNSQ